MAENKKSNENRLIDANALMDEFRRYMVERYDREKCVSEENCKTCERGCLWRKTVNKAPTVDAVEVVHAHWEDGYAIHNGKKVYDSIDCSHCEEIFKIESHDREYWKNRFKVCPFCGAVMDGGNEDG